MQGSNQGMNTELTNQELQVDEIISKLTAARS